MRRLPIEKRKAGLAQLLRGLHPGTALNEHFAGHGDIVYIREVEMVDGAPWAVEFETFPNVKDPLKEAR